MRHTRTHTHRWNQRRRWRSISNEKQNEQKKHTLHWIYLIISHILYIAIILFLFSSKVFNLCFLIIANGGCLCFFFFSLALSCAKTNRFEWFIGSICLKSSIKEKNKSKNANQKKKKICAAWLSNAIEMNGWPFRRWFRVNFIHCMLRRELYVHFWAIPMYHSQFAYIHHWYTETILARFAYWCRVV